MFSIPEAARPLTQGDLFEDCPLVGHNPAPGAVDLRALPARRWRSSVIVLTQACDLAQSKTAMVLCAQVHPAQQLVNDGTLKAAMIRDQVRRHLVFGWYFLPEVTTPVAMPEAIVDLRDIQAVPRVVLGGVFTFDQERTGLGRTISRQVWHIIHGTAEAAREKSQRRTTDPRTILIALALQALVPSTADGPQLPDPFHQIRERYAQVCSPCRLVGAVRDELGEFDIYFNDGQYEYRYEGLSSGEKMVLLLLIRFVAEHIHQSLVLVDELDLNQHPLWQRRLLHMIPRMGDGNQIIATTDSPYLRDAVPPDAVYDLGGLGDEAIRGGV